MRSLLSDVRCVSVGDLKLYPGNARRGSIDAIAESLRHNGQFAPIVVQESTSYVLSGNHTLRAAIQEGWTHIDAAFIDCDDEAARKINLVANRTNDLASYDEEALASLLTELGGDWEGTGFSQFDLDVLLADLAPHGWGGKNKDDAPPLGDEAVTQPGDLIMLGPHRLLCGDALNPLDFARLMDGQQADLVLTDPPYTVGYELHLSPTQRQYRRQDGKKIPNDSLSGVEAETFISRVMRAVSDSLKPGGVYYVFSPPGDTELDFRLALRDAGIPLRQALLWLKDSFVFGRQDYQWRHEVLMYGWREGAGHYFCGDFTQDTLWECPRPKRSKEHPTMKPVALLERAVLNSSRSGELVVDLFAGSGSTLIAAAAQGRRCSMIEIDPLYCDVIVARWELLTGETIR